jgi:8-oxo-dGTP pyrophosphatase MutT (NUDIX family)
LEKFSKLKPKNEFDTPKDEVLYSDDTLEVIKYEDWSIIKEKDSVVCIPFLIESNQIILRYEYIPTFKYVDGQEYHATLVCGGIENGETPEKALLRELEEEAGIVLREDFQFEAMKPLFISKGHTNKYYSYIIPLNERDYHEVVAKGDGSKEESMSKSVKVDVKYINSVNSSDLITDYMLLKLKEYLNLSI